MAQTLTEIKNLLYVHGLHPKKRLGQNFLHDANKMRTIMQAACIEPGQCVLEVGPGTGALTEYLLEAGAHVVAVEVDQDLQEVLRARLADRAGQWQLIDGDILAGKQKLNPQVIEALGDQPFKLVANLPYQVASPLLVNLLCDQSHFAGAVVMLQREVADRLSASPGGKDYGPLGILVNAMCHVQRVCILSPTCFWPRPKVDSAVVSLMPRAAPLTTEPRAFASFLHLLFGKRRKQIGSILGRNHDWPEDIQPDDRPETLDVHQLLKLQAVVG